VQPHVRGRRKADDALLRLARPQERRVVLHGSQLAVRLLQHPVLRDRRPRFQGGAMLAVRRRNQKPGQLDERRPMGAQVRPVEARRPVQALLQAEEFQRVLPPEGQGGGRYQMRTELVRHLRQRGVQTRRLRQQAQLDDGSRYGSYWIAATSNVDVADECGICGGDNSKCEEITGNYNISMTGYKTVLRIPKGSSNIDIRQNANNDTKYLGELSGERRGVSHGGGAFSTGGRRDRRVRLEQQDDDRPATKRRDFWGRHHQLQRFFGGGRANHHPQKSQVDQRPGAVRAVGRRRLLPGHHLPIHNKQSERPQVSTDLLPPTLLLILSN
jgi:hypothetical protein